MQIRVSGALGLSALKASPLSRFYVVFGYLSLAAEPPEPNIGQYCVVY